MHVDPNFVIISGKPIVQLQGLDNHHKAPFGVKLYKPHSALGLGQANNLQEITQHCLFSKTHASVVCNNNKTHAIKTIATP